MDDEKPESEKKNQAKYPLVMIWAHIRIECELKKMSIN